MFYAQLNDENICIGVQESPSLQPSEKLIKIESYDEDLLRRKYEDGEWSEEKFPPFPQPSPQEQIDVLQADNAELFYQNMLLESDNADLWYEVMKLGGAE